MKRTLFLSVLVAGVALALAVGAVSVLADKGGPGHGAEHGVATGLQDGGGGVGAQQDGDDGDDGEGAQHIAQVIADTFGGDLTAEASDVSQEDVLALHEEGIGFGALYKLYLLAAANSTSVDTLLDTIPTNADGKHQFAFGKMFKEATDDVSVLTAGEDGVPKNLGQAKKALK